MDRADVMKLIDGQDFLAHYGVKGQEWGVRRYQNEDGSLTPEGRKRYGLNTKYSDMSIEDLTRSIKRKQTENQYVGEMTKSIRKKREDIGGFVKAASETAGKGGDLVKNTVIKKRNDDMGEYISELSKEKSAWEKAKKGASDEQKKILDQKIAPIQQKIDAAKEAKQINKNVGDFIPAVARAPGQYSDTIAKASTKGELEKATSDAYRKAQEMDDETLEKVFKRMQLERQYDELVNPPKPSTYERGREIMQTAGTVLSIALTAVSIYSILRGKGDKDKDKAKQSAMDDGGEFLSHYRTKGSKNGVRRYQNEDGTLTPEGYRHYGIDPNGRQAASPDEVAARQKMAQRAAIEKQRSQMAAQRDKVKMQAKQNAYTQKIQQRAMIREARNQAHLNQIYAKQQIREQKAFNKQDAREQYIQNRLDMRAKAENRENMRKNIIKGALGIAAIGAAVGVGYHVLINRSRDLAHARNIETLAINHKNNINKILTQGKVDQELENIKGKNSLNLENVKGKNAIALESKKGQNVLDQIRGQADADIRKDNAFTTNIIRKNNNETGNAIRKNAATTSDSIRKMNAETANDIKKNDNRTTNQIKIANNEASNYVIRSNADADKQERLDASKAELKERSDASEASKTERVNASQAQLYEAQRAFEESVNSDKVKEAEEKGELMYKLGKAEGQAEVSGKVVDAQIQAQKRKDKRLEINAKNRTPKVRMIERLTKAGYSESNLAMMSDAALKKLFDSLGKK